MLEHLRSCDACEARANFLGEVEAALGVRATWGAQAEGCLHARDALDLLTGGGSDRDQHLLRCPACQAEVNALSEVLLEHEAGELAAPTAKVRTRLRRLATLSEVTTIEEPRARRGRSGRSSGRASGRRRVSSRRTSARRRRSGSTRRRSGVGRVPSHRVQVTQPTWAWGVLAAAAVLLVALALVLNPSPRKQVARDSNQIGPDPVRVSDMKQDPATPGPVTSVDPNYPLPAVEPNRRPLRPEPEPEEDVEPLDRDPTAPAKRKPLASKPRARKPVSKKTKDETSARGKAEVLLSDRRPPIRDDGGRLELALGRLNGSIALKPQGAAAWKKLSRQAASLKLKPGDRLRARGGGFVSLSEGGFELCLGRDTEVVVRAAKAGPVLDLTRGRILCEVASLAAGKRFVVGTAQAEFSVLGTLFAVEANAADSQVIVAEGTVRARNGHGETKVPAGRKLALDARRTPGTPQAFKSSELAWAKPFAPQRKLLFAATFDDKKLRGFVGALSREHGPRGGLAITMTRRKPDQPHWGYWAHVPPGRLQSFRPGKDVYIQFSVWVEKPCELVLQSYNDSQKREFLAPFSHPGGYWRTFTANTMELKTFFDHGKNPVRAGDLFNDLEIYAAKPGETRTILVDDVFIYRRVYR